MEITVTNVPEKRASEEATEKMRQMAADRNQAIAKWFDMEPVDLEVKLYFSTGQMRFLLDPNGEGTGVFGGYIEGQQAIHLAHPEPIAPIFGENLDKEMSVLADYALTKMYLTMKYFPEGHQFKIYYKYVAEYLAQLTSGSFKTSAVDFDIKMYPNKKPKKEIGVAIGLFLMHYYSGLAFIYEHLDTIMQDCDIYQSIHSIYHKTMDDLIAQYKREKESEQKEMQQVKKNK